MMPGMLKLSGSGVCVCAGAQTGAAAIMIAERAAGLLKGGPSQHQGAGERTREPALAGV